MTTYYIELFQFSNDADISKISTNTLKEVINDFTNELTKRCAEQKLNIHGVGGPVSDVRSEGEQLGNEAGEKSVREGTINTEGSNRKRWSENDDTFIEM